MSIASSVGSATTVADRGGFTGGVGSFFAGLTLGLGFPAKGTKLGIKLGIKLGMAAGTTPVTDRINPCAVFHLSET